MASPHMFLHRIRAFSLAGFTVWIDASWLILAALLIWSLALGLFPRFAPHQSMVTYLWMAVFGTAGFFLSIVIHELAHSLVARRYQMPIVGITLFIFGGVAELHQEPGSARAEFLTAAVGPLTSFIVGACCMALVALGGPGQPPAVLGVLSYLGSLNGLLAIFNLVPAFPLDGGRMLRAGLWHWLRDFGRATHIAAIAGQLFGVLLIVLGIVQFGLGNLIGGIWLFFIGLFLHGAAGAAQQQLAIRHALTGLPVSALMQRNPIAVDIALNIEELVENYFYRYFFHAFPVLQEGRLVGCIMATQIRDLPRGDWARLRVADVMQPCLSEILVPSNCNALEALTKMQAGHHKRLLVVEGQVLRGILALSDMLQYLSLKQKLEQPDSVHGPLHGTSIHAS